EVDLPTPGARPRRARRGARERRDRRPRGLAAPPARDDGVREEGCEEDDAEDVEHAREHARVYGRVRLAWPPAPGLPPPFHAHFTRLASARDDTHRRVDLATPSHLPDAACPKTRIAT